MSKFFDESVTKFRIRVRDRNFESVLILIQIEVGSRIYRVFQIRINKLLQCLARPGSIDRMSCEVGDDSKFYSYAEDLGKVGV